MLIGDNMKKILLILCLLLCAGCSINYNLTIDENSFLENTKITGDQSAIYNTYLTKPLPLSKYAPIQSETDDKIDGVEYYDVNNISNLNEVGLEFTGTFNDKIPLSESNILSYGAGNVSVSRNDSIVEINVPSNLKVFNQYSDLDSITVNIETKYKVLNNNADSISGNKYTWIINRSNYKDKTISFSYDIENGISKNYFKDNPLIIFNICLVIIVFVCFIIYFIINRRYNKKNSL